jgi:hypothetical protein
MAFENGKKQKTESPGAENTSVNTTIKVECYSGYRGEETPRRFWLEGNLIDVKTVVDQWRDPEHRYFKVAVEGDATYILRHDSVTFDWELVL